MSCAQANWVGSKLICRVMQLKLHKPTMAIGYSLRMCAQNVDSTNPGRSNLVFRSKPIAEAEMSNRLIAKLLCHIGLYIFHLTSLFSPHYLVKHKSAKFVNNASRVSKLGSTEIGLHLSKLMGHRPTYYYRDNLLAQKLLPDLFRLSQGGFFVFQQDGAPAHRARDTVAFLEQRVPDFIPPTLWPPNSPNLNPVDYSIWSVLQMKVYRFGIANVYELKT